MISTNTTDPRPRSKRCPSRRYRSCCTVLTALRNALWFQHAGLDKECSWASYREAEFGISRAQAYRRLDIARALAAVHGTVDAGTDTSRTRDTGPAAVAALDFGLSQRVLIAVSGPAGHVAELITRRLATLAHSGLQALAAATVRAVVRQAVRDVRTAPVTRRSASGSRAHHAAPRRRRPRRQHVRDGRVDARSRVGLPVRHRRGRRPGAAVRGDR
ncbi:hypothetical protein FNV62_01050 [Streptomyces sp. RLB3-17]|nr:hypothetical protein FNV58_02505 [Streptomyces sp. RLB1-9]QDO16884.1 hypothetical protein FNV65_01075 [Streptomyces sp. S1A1-8]QDO27007.1 hypothetical protein FNV63_01070 [Streptomyces sp. S1A1-3]QDO37046.1 hypothetical protein FNV62_01050 [Streptomyces sp. RLB3-17]